MLEPETREIETGDGSKRQYVLHKFPAIAGRELITQYPVTGLPKVGEYKANEVLMLKLMAYVGVPQANGDTLMLTTASLVDNHVPDAETLMRLEMAMMEKNVSFFRNGKGSDFFSGIVRKVTASIMSTLTGSLPQSSENGTPPSES